MLLARTVIFLTMFYTTQIALARSVEPDKGLLATGKWSEIVRDHDEHATYALRGRLLVYDDKTPTSENKARVYLELQNVFEGGWSRPFEIYFHMDESPISNLAFEMQDAHGKPIPEFPVKIRGALPYPYHVLLPCDSTIRLRADLYTFGGVSNAGGLEILVNGGCWLIRPNATNEFLLSGSLKASEQPKPFDGHVWRGTLRLPAVEIPVGASGHN